MVSESVFQLIAAATLEHRRLTFNTRRNDDLVEHGKHWAESASQQELHDYAMEKAKAYRPNLTEIVRATPVEGIIHPPLLIRDMLPQELPRGRVTLIGDAAHPMSPCKYFPSSLKELIANANSPRRRR